MKHKWHNIDHQPLFLSQPWVFLTNWRLCFHPFLLLSFLCLNSHHQMAWAQFSSGSREVHTHPASQVDGTPVPSGLITRCQDQQTGNGEEGEGVRDLLLPPPATFLCRAQQRPSAKSSRLQVSGTTFYWNSVMPNSLHSASGSFWSSYNRTLKSKASTHWLFAEVGWPLLSTSGPQSSARFRTLGRLLKKRMLGSTPGISNRGAAWELHF